MKITQAERRAILDELASELAPQQELDEVTTYDLEQEYKMAYNSALVLLEEKRKAGTMTRRKVISFDGKKRFAYRKAVQNDQPNPTA